MRILEASETVKPSETFEDRLRAEVAHQEEDVAGGTDLYPGDEIHVPVMPDETPTVGDVEYTEHLTIRYLRDVTEGGQRVAVYEVEEVHS